MKLLRLKLDFLRLMVELLRLMLELLKLGSEFRLRVSLGNFSQITYSVDF